MEASREVSSNGLEEYRVSVQKFQDEISGYDEQLETFGPAREAKLVRSRSRCGLEATQLIFRTLWHDC